MITTQPWQLPGVHGEPIYGDADIPDSEPRGVAILCHGYKGYKDYGFFPMLGHCMAEQGLIALRFNFSYSGMTRNVETFERPDLFEQYRFSYGVADLKTVAKAAHDGAILEATKGLPQVWFGHSRGGFICIHTAADCDGPMPKGVILAAARARPSVVTPEMRQAIERDGYFPEVSSRTGQDLKIGKCFFDDVDHHPTHFNGSKAIARINAPICIIHGSGDATVDFANAHELAGFAPDAVLHEIEDASHTYDCPNPLPLDATPPDNTSRMLRLAVDFAVEHVNPA